MCEREREGGRRRNARNERGVSIDHHDDKTTNIAAVGIGVAVFVRSRRPFLSRSCCWLKPRQKDEKAVEDFKMQ